MKYLAISAIFIAALLLSSGCISFGNGADGTAKDKIARISYGGWIWKTWRVELQNDHPVSDGSGGTIAQRYGVENNPELIAQLQHYEDTGETVRISYRSNIFVFDWDYADPEVIVAVQAANSSK